MTKILHYFYAFIFVITANCTLAAAGDGGAVPGESDVFPEDKRQQAVFAALASKLAYEENPVEALRKRDYAPLRRAGYRVITRGTPETLSDIDPSWIEIESERRGLGVLPESVTGDGGLIQTLRDHQGHIRRQLRNYSPAAADDPLLRTLASGLSQGLLGRDYTASAFEGYDGARRYARDLISGIDALIQGIESLPMSGDSRFAVNAIVLESEQEDRDPILAYRGTADIDDMIADLGIGSLRLNADKIYSDGMSHVHGVLGRDLERMLDSLTQLRDDDNSLTGMGMHILGQIFRTYAADVEAAGPVLGAGAAGADGAGAEGTDEEDDSDFSDVDEETFSAVRGEGPVLGAGAAGAGSGSGAGERAEPLSASGLEGVIEKIGTRLAHMTGINLNDFVPFLMDVSAAKFKYRLMAMERFRNSVLTDYWGRGIIETGHSLGGGFATALQYKSFKEDVTTFAFNPPNMKPSMDAAGKQWQYSAGDFLDQMFCSRGRGKSDPLKTQMIVPFVFSDPARYIEMPESVDLDAYNRNVFVLTHSFRDGGFEPVSHFQYDERNSLGRYTVLRSQTTDRAHYSVYLHKMNPLVNRLLFGLDRAEGDDSFRPFYGQASYATMPGAVVEVEPNNEGLVRFLGLEEAMAGYIRRLNPELMQRLILGHIQKPMATILNLVSVDVAGIERYRNSLVKEAVDILDLEGIYKKVKSAVNQSRFNRGYHDYVARHLENTLLMAQRTEDRGAYSVSIEDGEVVAKLTPESSSDLIELKTAWDEAHPLFFTVGLGAAPYVDQLDRGVFGTYGSGYTEELSLDVIKGLIRAIEAKDSIEDIPAGYISSKVERSKKTALEALGKVMEPATRLQERGVNVHFVRDVSASTTLTYSCHTYDPDLIALQRSVKANKHYWLHAMGEEPVDFSAGAPEGRFAYIRGKFESAKGTLSPVSEYIRELVDKLAEQDGGLTAIGTAPAARPFEGSKRILQKELGDEVTVTVFKYDHGFYISYPGIGWMQMNADGIRLLENIDGRYRDITE